MPIAALPPTTVRAIGSSSIISDPCSLAKELLDNALDAGASSVTVETSQDTVDMIQVKDNGHGIPADDYSLVCRRTFTSKIQTVEDLRNVGGKSFGFRGEALASAAEISGALTVSTRVESEPVGSLLKYGRSGELVSTERISHPVGTTVRISNLFQQIPVRRQTAVKNSKKTLARIRKMVQAYAAARPSIRFTFKVLRAKNESGSWMYAPGKNGILNEVALKIAGTDVASNCILKQWPSADAHDGEASEGNSNFRLTALLPRLGSDFTKFNNQGQFISIDGRPISARRGIAKDIVKSYKSYIRFASTRGGLSPPINDPFLCLHIMCPEGTYDVNIEPSKDDVLFEDQQAVLSLVDGLLKNVYGDKPDIRMDGLGELDRGASHQNGFEAPSPGRQPEHIATAHAPVATPQARDSVSVRSLTRPEQPSDISPGHQTGLGKPSRSPFVQSSNPRLSCILPSSDVQSPRPPFPRRRPGPPGTHTSPSGLPMHPDSSLPSPVSSLDSPPAHNTAPSPLSSRTSSGSGAQTQLSSTTPVRDPRQLQRDRDRERYGNGSLDTWFLKLSQASQTPSALDQPEPQNNEPPLSQLTQDRFGSGETSPSEVPRNGSPESVMLLDTSQTPSRTATQTAKSGNRPQGLPVLEQWSARLWNPSEADEDPELQKAMEFETRKKAAVKERRMQLQSSAPTNSPHQSRYLAARAALSSQPDSSAPRPVVADTIKSTGSAKPVLSPHDPRAYLMRLQNSDGPGCSKLKRIMSTKLPFEKIPGGHDLHLVSLTVPAELPLLCTSLKQLSKTDLYTQSGDHFEAFISLDISSATKTWHDRLSALIKANYKSTENVDITNIRFDFSSIIQRSTATADI